MQIGRGGGQNLNRLRRKVGAILIEFAFAIPVFLVLIYYIHDLPKQKLMQRKMQFVAYEVAAILQNIAKQRKVVCLDLSNAMRLAALSYFPGITQYSPTGSWGNMPLGYFLMVNVFYVMGIEEDMAEIKWNYRIHPDGGGYIYGKNSMQDSIIKARSGAPSEIHPNLRISKGESKVIVECILYSDPLIRVSTTGTPTRGMSKRELFGFLFYNPVSPESKRKFAYFTSFAIFTPVGTGFSEKAPK